MTKHRINPTIDPPLSHCAMLPEIAEGLGITDQALYNLRDRYDTFPEPLRYFGVAAVYYTAEVEWFHQQVGRGYGGDQVDVGTGKRKAKA